MIKKSRRQNINVKNIKNILLRGQVQLQDIYIWIPASAGMTLGNMKRWEVQNSSKLNIQNSQFDELIKILLTNRGLTNEKEIDEFLHPKLVEVTPKNVGISLTQLKKTIARIESAIEKKEQIIVYGDYDVDGITGAAILWEALTELGARAMPYLPHRVEEGYGLSIKGIDHVREMYPDTALIITVDNGIVANEAVDYANSLKIEAIVTDHHAAQEEKDKQPKSLATVHTTQLCGAGVAYVLAKELLLHFKKIEKDDQLNRYLELATLGTIADLVPLIGSNRTIVYHGLKVLCQSKRVGLQALFREAGCDITTVGVYEIGFIIAPRLNAAGRLESAMDSLRVLCTKDPKRADDLAFQLGRVNKERQKIMFDSSLHAVTLVKDRGDHEKKLLFVSHESYQEGVIGLIAGKLVESFYRPAIVVSIGQEKSKGSVRSIAGFNIIEFLRSHSEHFINVGGHPMAAGFSVKTENVEMLKQILEQKAEEIIDGSILQRTLKVDTKLSLSDVSPELYRALQTLSPFGMKNPEPLFLSEGVRIEEMRLLGREGKHVRFIFSKLDSEKGEITEYEAVGFGMGERVGEFKIGDSVDIVYTIDENTWNGRTKLQLKVKDIRTNR